MPVTDVRTLLIPFALMSRSKQEQLEVFNRGAAKTNNWNRVLRLTVSAGSTLHQVHGILQQEKWVNIKGWDSVQTGPSRTGNINTIPGHLT